MAKCIRKRIPKVKICVGDLRHKIEIQTRSLSANKVGEFNPQETFSLVVTSWAGVETPNGSSKFLGVNINEDTTHIFVMRYSSVIANLEVANNFLLFKSRRMRILSVSNMNEDNIFLAIECTERGDDSKAASEA